MATIDLTKAVDRVRLMAGDYTDFQLLSDSEISWCLESNSQNEAAATKMAASLILGKLSRESDLKLGTIQISGGQAFNQYLKFLQTVINNPSNSMNAIRLYAAGMSKEERGTDLADADLIRHKRISPRDCGLWDWDYFRTPYFD